ncbi:cupin domain-containing protein [Streptomyces sp. NPDC090022]|uniref:cupin domain-containing protein n=1 Tax=Streptomyces sp. NPDC090022 TaxID=3365920 RepID=UPI00382705E8
MTPSTAGAEGISLADLVEGTGKERRGALWRLRARNRQLDANVVRLPPDTPVAEHVEPQVDVLLIVVSGSGVLTLGGVEREVAPGTLALLPRGIPRAVLPGPDGLVFVTAHRRRAGLRIGRSRPAPEPDSAPHCALHRVCRQCRRHAIEADARFCSRCGSPLPGAGGDTA